MCRGVPDPVRSISAPSRTCGWTPCGLGPSRCRSRLLDPHGLASRSRHALHHALGRASPGLSPRCRNGAMRRFWSTGFKMPTSRRPGRKATGACNKRAGVRGPVSHRRPTPVRDLQANDGGRGFSRTLGTRGRRAADRRWEVWKTVGTASAGLRRADVHPTSPQPPQSTLSGRSRRPMASGADTSEPTSRKPPIFRSLRFAL
jgi:hypothetical protein